ncbi:MAG: NTP transferase domain-containing protein [Candidatus Methylacidiphilales bacterium]
MKPNIFILSKAIQTGKTTALMEWCKTQKNIAGILTPDIEGNRKLFDIEHNTIDDFEVKNPLPTDEITPIGKFNFYTNIFTKAQQIITNSNDDYLIIDEIGRLELNQNKGLEPALGKVISTYTNYQNDGSLILVIRDYLLEDCIKKYQLQHAKIIQDLAEITTENELVGVVLAGGKSSRMATDKAFINYHGKAQIYFLSEQLKMVTNNVILSINQKQKSEIDTQYEFIVDSEKYLDSGPINGLLTTHEKYPNKPLIVLACDYPLLSLTDILNLKFTFLKHQKTTTFFNPESGFREPLLGVYHPNDLAKLLAFYNNGNTSLQQFLNTIDAIKLEAINLQNIKSIDNPTDLEAIKNQINSQV